MITDWIDAMQDVWAGISAPGFDQVVAPYMIKRAEYPATIDPAKLERSPIALTLWSDVHFVYSAGGPLIGFYTGITEFHVAPNTDRALIPSLMVWPKLIVTAAAANMQLGGRVSHFVLQARDDQIVGPGVLQYGNEAEHWGFLVHWEVKEILNGQFTVSA